MGRSLGRAYPTDVQAAIARIGRNIDLYMASTLAYQLAGGEDVSPRVRMLNARLVNDIIIVSDEISDEEARARLARIDDEAFEVAKLFRAAGVPLGEAPLTPTAERIAIVPRAQAEKMLAQFRTAWELYPGVVDRYAAVRQAAGAALALPVSGAAVGELMATIDAALQRADRDVFQAQELYGRLEKEFLPAAGAAVEIDRAAFDLMRNWVSDINRADEAVKRLEGIAQLKPVEVAALAPRAMPWWAYAAGAGLVLLGIGLFVDWK